jgi:hypothetical protein
MRREPDDARGLIAPTPPGGVAAIAGTLEGRSRLHSEPHDALCTSELVFPTEADTLRTHEVPVLPRRDTTPVPPVEGAALSTSALDDDLFEDGLDDDTETQLDYFEPSDEPTSPTLSLANRSDAAREVYRRFLASEYAPALELANDLIAQGEDDPMLVTIARECRSSIAALSSLPPPSLDDGAPRPRMPFAGLAPCSVPWPSSPSDRSPFGGAVHSGMFDASMTIEEVASLTGAPVEHVLALLERFVAMGVLPSRPPR